MARMAPTMAAMMLTTMTSIARSMNQWGTKRVLGDGSGGGLLRSFGRIGVATSSRKNTVKTPKNHLPESPARHNSHNCQP